MVAMPKVEANARQTAALLQQLTVLKAQYCRRLDAKEWDRWESLFTEDAVVQMGPDPELSVRGRSAIRKLLTAQLRRARTHHEAREPELSVESPDRVRVVWEMTDLVETPLYRLEGAGFYEDHYVRRDHGWQIVAVRLHRTKVDLQPKSAIMHVILWAHTTGVLKRLSPSADRTLGQALHVGLREGERP